MVPLSRLRNAATHPMVIRLLLAIPLVLLLGRVPQPVVRVGPQQSVKSINLKMGVHTRLTDEVEEWKIKRTLEMVREMGAQWIVEYFPWAYYEPEQGLFDWTHPDLVVNHAIAQGLTVIARIDFVPAWARPADTTFRHLPEESYDAYAGFVQAFVTHFSGRVQHVIIWNEPNLSFEWGYRLPDPEAYTRLLRAAYLRAKEADPDVVILAAGLAPTLAPPGSEWGMDDLLYLQRMLDAGARQYLDGLAIHAYGWTLPPSDPQSLDTLNFARAALIHDLLVRNGHGDVPCYVTEAGWNDHTRWAQAVAPGLRIDYTLQAYEMVRGQWPWCKMAAIWVFRYPRPARNFQDGFSFVTPSFAPKLIYQQVQEYSQGQQNGLQATSTRG